MLDAGALGPVLLTPGKQPPFPSGPPGTFGVVVSHDPVGGGVGSVVVGGGPGNRRRRCLAAARTMRLRRTLRLRVIDKHDSSRTPSDENYGREGYECGQTPH